MKFIVVSGGRQDTFDPSQIKQIEFNDIVRNPGVLICPTWKQFLLFYPGCGIDRMFGEWFRMHTPDRSSTPKYRSPEPPKVRAAPTRDASVLRGTQARLEFNDGREPRACVLLWMSVTELTIQEEKTAISREKVKMIFPQRRPAKDK